MAIQFVNNFPWCDGSHGVVHERFADGAEQRRKLEPRSRCHALFGQHLLHALELLAPQGVGRVGVVVIGAARDEDGRGGYYDGQAFFRVIRGFVAQFGISGDTAVTRAWEGRSIPDDTVRARNERGTLAFARIEAHYFVNRGFFDTDDQLLRNAARLKDIPGVIVHGRYDVVTPVKNAFDLVQAWPQADLRVVPDSGHAMTEPGIVHELIAATRGFAARG